MPVERVDWQKVMSPNPSEIQVTWLGHACFLVQMDGMAILTDPVWSDRCTPVDGFGPVRYRPPPCKLTELPPIDIVLISHNHVDHLDLFTVRCLGNIPLWFAPLGHREWFAAEGIDRLIEMNWWDSYPLGPSIDIVCLPAQHWSKRGLFDDMTSLWSGWAVLGCRKLFFAGDTGYGPAFKEIGKKFGPFDLALIPIGAYEPRWMMSCQHVEPSESVSIHLDIESRQSVGMHWGTWILTNEDVYEPPLKLKQEVARRNIESSSFIALNHGQTFATSPVASKPLFSSSPNPTPPPTDNVTLVDVR
jgi:N-acyl-phosphatidylethanolamine-hydrolysing phospholipase D